MSRKRSDVGELILSHPDWTTSKLAKEAGCSRRTVERYRKRLDADKRLDSDKTVFRLREERGGLKKLYKHAVKRVHELEGELAASFALRDNLKTHVIEPKGDGTSSEAVVIVLLSDWHVEERVINSNGNSYSLAIAKARADHCFRRIVRLVEKERQDVEINELVLALLGDFTTSNLIDEMLETAQLQPIEAMIFAEELLASGIQYLLDNTDLVLTIPACVGNHSRITKNRVHIATEAGNSLETMMYHHLANHFKDEPRVRFIIQDGYHIYLEIMGHTVRFHHGHQIGRGGDGIGGILTPIYRKIMKWNRARHADIDCLGHYHQYHSLDTVCVNGSMIGDSPFSIAIGGSQRPCQAFFLLDSKRGKTIDIPILFED